MGFVRSTLPWLAVGLCLVGLLVGCQHKSTSAAGTTGLATAPGPSPLAGGLDGSWKAVAVESDGEQLPATEVANNPAVLEIAGNRVTLRAGNRIVTEGTLRVDDSQQPKTIDLNGITLTGARAGQSGGSVGVYEVSGDTLRICFSGGARPKTFETRPGSGTTLITYRRVR